MGYYSRTLSEQQLSVALSVADDRWKAALFRGVPPAGSGLSGDGQELVAGIGACTEAQPGRFAELLVSLPNGTRPFVMAPILNGLAWLKAPLPADLLLRIAKRCHDVPKRPLGIELARLIDVHAKEDLLREVLGLLSWYALEAKRQMSGDGSTSVDIRDKEDEWWEEDFREGFKHQGNPVWNGRRIVRGVATESIGLAVSSRPERLGIFLATLEELAADRSTSVRAVLAQACCRLYEPHPEVAMRLVLRLTDTRGLEVPEERWRNAILSTDSVRNFLEHLRPADYETLQPLVERCEQSGAMSAMTYAARTAGKAADLSRHARETCERSLFDVIETRRAAAGGLSNALRRDPENEYVVGRLSSLFYDEHSPTRESACGFVHFVKPDALRRSPGLVRAFLASPAYAKNTRWYSLQLSRAVLGMPDLEYGLAIMLFREGDRAAGAALAKGAMERNADPAITAKCEALLETSRARILNELRAPWEEPGFAPPAQKLPPVPRWRDKYEGKPPPAPRKPPPGRRGPGGATRDAGGLNWKHLFLVFLLFFVLGFFRRAKYSWLPPPSMAASLKVAVVGTLAVGGWSYLSRVAPRLAQSRLTGVAAAFVVTALIFAWVWFEG